MVMTFQLDKHATKIQVTNTELMIISCTPAWYSVRGQSDSSVSLFSSSSQLLIRMSLDHIFTEDEKKGATLLAVMFGLPNPRLDRLVLRLEESDPAFNRDSESGCYLVHDARITNALIRNATELTKILGVSTFSGKEMAEQLFGCNDGSYDEALFVILGEDVDHKQEQGLYSGYYIGESLYQRGGFLSDLCTKQLILFEQEYTSRFQPLWIDEKFKKAVRLLRLAKGKDVEAAKKNLDDARNEYLHRIHSSSAASPSAAP